MLLWSFVYLPWLPSWPYCLVALTLALVWACLDCLNLCIHLALFQLLAFMLWSLVLLCSFALLSWTLRCCAHMHIHIIYMYTYIYVHIQIYICICIYVCRPIKCCMSWNCLNSCLISFHFALSQVNPEMITVFMSCLLWSLRCFHCCLVLFMHSAYMYTYTYIYIYVYKHVYIYIYVYVISTLPCLSCLVCVCCLVHFTFWSASLLSFELRCIVCWWSCICPTFSMYLLPWCTDIHVTLCWTC